MAKVLGVGGLFFKAKDPDQLRQWYQKVLNLQFEDWGGVFFTPDAAARTPGAGTVWSPFPAASGYFAPSTRDFMFNFIVDDMDAMLERCKENGVEVNQLPPEPNGRFAHLIDPEGTKIELWEPKG